jgi:hypothetical protein
VVPKKWSIANVRVFQKPQKCFFIDQYQKFTNQTKTDEIHEKVILAKISDGSLMLRCSETLKNTFYMLNEKN